MRITLLILWLSTVAAFARLGESNIEIYARYGPVVSREETGTNTWTGTYNFKDYQMIVHFRNNKSEEEIVCLVEHRKFSDEERDGLMKAIAGDGEWEKIESSATSITWINKKNQDYAAMKDEVDTGSVLAVSTPECLDQDAAKRKEAEKAKASGF